jgi:ferredoxin
MATKITEECINCGACEAECPTGAISEGSERYEIDANLCVECVGYFEELQCNAVCPTQCCVRDADHDESEEQLIAKAKKLNPDIEINGDDFPSHFRV